MRADGGGECSSLNGSLRPGNGQREFDCEMVAATNRTRALSAGGGTVQGVLLGPRDKSRLRLPRRRASPSLELGAGGSNPQWEPSSRIY